VQIGLHEGDLITLFTDGLLESTHDLGEGERRIRVALSELHAETLPEAAHVIRESVLFDGCRDDVAVITLRLSAGPKEDALEWEFDARDGRLAHQSRGFFLQYLLERGVAGDDFAGAELVFGEIIGNVVRHAPGPVRIRVDWSGAHPVLEMTDEGGMFVVDANLPSDPLSEVGRGLFLVEALTKSFKVERIENRTRARAVLNLQRP
jgi:anti-sigma regulatory factor (Ser/Thr protein kinase)